MRACAFFSVTRKLFEMLRVDIVHLQHLANVGEGEAEPLAAQHQDEARAVAMGIDALIADALRREQPLILIEPQRAMRDAGLGRQIANGIKPRLGVRVLAFARLP